MNRTSDALAGAAAGLAATALMTLFSRSVSIEQRGMIESPEGESPADKAASEISEAFFDRPLRGRARDRGGKALHWLFGASVGALYAVTTRPGVNPNRGLLFGAALWAAATETAQPLLGWSKKPTEFPLSTHLLGLVAHLVYGASLDSVSAALKTGARRA